MTDRRGTELPWDLWGRRVRPVHFTLALSLIFLGSVQLTDATPLGRGWGGDLVWVLSVMGSGLLTAGWFARSNRLADWGLTLAAAAWASRTAAVYLTGTVTFGTLPLTVGLSACWAVLAAGAWVLESADHRWSR